MIGSIIVGGNGFIGTNLALRLMERGRPVRVVDRKVNPWEIHNGEYIEDARDKKVIISAARNLVVSCGVNEIEIYQLAADMGGAGYIFTGENDYSILSNNLAVNVAVSEAAIDIVESIGLKVKVFYSSSACIYPQEIQEQPDCAGLREDMAYPANPDSDYGWEKLVSEHLYLSMFRNKGIDVRIARFHNIYGPYSSYKDGREKAPAAMCRKALESDGKMEIWGDGKQTRSFLYIDDCLEAIDLLMRSDETGPINIGSTEMVTIDQLANLAIGFSVKETELVHIEGPTGVRGRNSDNTMIEKALGWKPRHSLEEGMEKLFNWIKEDGNY